MKSPNLVVPFLLVLASGAALGPLWEGQADEKPLAARGGAPTGNAPQPAGPLTPVEMTGIKNALRWTDNLYSGACPQGEAGFKALAARGVKTIVTVDGAQPDVELARKYGLRYVHIPVEYSGIVREDAIRIIRAVRDLPGPVFIHCHHGLHRSPAAAALVAIALAHYDNARAHAALQQAGTGLNYTGLWKNVDDFKVPTAAEIEAAEHGFAEKAPLKGMVAAMISLDDQFDNLKAARAAGWKATATHPDVDPAHEALLLRESYAELKRSPTAAKYPADFMARLDAAETHARALETAIRGGKAEDAGTALDAAKADCGSCHKLYRDSKG